MTKSMTACIGIAVMVAASLCLAAATPVPAQADPSDPVPNNPVPNNPDPSNPVPEQPGPTHPEPTHPQPTDPEPTDPEPTRPEPTTPPKTETAEITYASAARGEKVTVVVTVALPGDYDKAKAYPLLLALPPGPGTQQMVDAVMGNYFQKEGSARGFVVVSPAVQGQTLQKDAAAMTAALFAYLDANVSYDASRVTLAGASNGGLGAFFVAAAEAKRFNALVALPGGYPGQARQLAGWRGKSVWMMAGEKDTSWVRLARATKALLEREKATVTLDILPGQGHVLQIDPQALYDWIQKQPALKTRDAPAGAGR